MAAPTVELRGIVKRYASQVAVAGVDLAVADGEFVSLLGPSGCGKTTTLRIIAGFIEPEEGEVRVMGEDVSSRPPHKRDMGMVYQNYALFPHMTVFDNVAYGLRMRKAPRPEIQARVSEALGLVRLEGLSGRYPGQLSGGQQQRVALARAIAIRPKVLLLDEPLSNLDAKLRKEMQVELRDLQRRLGITTLYVTHDQEEALVLSDRIVVMHEGKVMQIGEPGAIYHRPANTFVANFIGTTNVFRGRIVQRPESGGRPRFESDGGTRLELGAGALSAPFGQDLIAVIRPEQVRLGSEAADGTVANALPGKVSHVVYLGARTMYHVDLPGGERVTADVQNPDESTAWRVGDTVPCHLPPDAFHLVTA
jgi:spermidine/putrescine ABC transporter ATP-binding subunit